MSGCMSNTGITLRIILNLKTPFSSSEPGKSTICASPSLSATKPQRRVVLLRLPTTPRAWRASPSQIGSSCGDQRMGVIICFPAKQGPPRPSPTQLLLSRRSFHPSLSARVLAVGDRAARTSLHQPHLASPPLGIPRRHCASVLAFVPSLRIMN